MAIFIILLPDLLYTRERKTDTLISHYTIEIHIPHKMNLHLCHETGHVTVQGYFLSLKFYT